MRERLTQTVRALETAGMPYAVVGDHAVAAWVSRVDEAAVRITPDVDVLLRQNDLEAAKAALSGAGFAHRHVGGVDIFPDGPDAKARDAVHVLFAGEKVRPDHVMAAPDVSESETSTAFRLVK